MAIVNFMGAENGYIISLDAPYQTATLTNSLVDAVSESVFFVGQANISGGTSITVNNSCYIVIRFGTITHTSASTILRVGIQDVNASGINDGTFDVYVDVSGVGSVTASTVNEFQFTTGSKTINNGDLIAVGLEMTARGNADAFNIASHQHAYFPYVTGNFPYRILNGTKANTGTIGIGISDPSTKAMFLGMHGIYPGINDTTVYTFSSTTEYGVYFRVPHKCTIRGAIFQIGAIAITDNFDIKLYSDPTGTPVAERTVSIDADVIGSTSATPAPILGEFSTAFELQANTYYAITILPTTANTITTRYRSFYSRGALYKSLMGFGKDASTCSRSGSGAFTINTETLINCSLILQGVDDGAGSGGGEHSYTF